MTKVQALSWLVLTALLLVAGCATDYPQSNQPAYNVLYGGPMTTEPDPASGSGNASESW